MAVVASLSMSTQTAKKSKKPVQNRTGRPRNTMSIGVPVNKFAKWMKSQGLEVEDVAKKLKVSVSSIYGYRRGNRPPVGTGAGA